MRIKRELFRYLHSLEFYVFIILIILAIYFYKTSRKKKYAFFGLTNDGYIPPFRAKYIRYGKRKKRATSKMEEKCRKILEKIYNRKFPPIRPDFLKSPATGMNLELDCYNDKLKIGLEYNGKQHSVYTPYYHQNNPKAFMYQVAKDDFKAKKCRAEGITLISIPYYVTENRLEEYIKDKLKKCGKL